MKNLAGPTFLAVVVGGFTLGTLTGCNRDADATTGLPVEELAPAPSRPLAPA
jgi:hypothetical protein